VSKVPSRITVICASCKEIIGHTTKDYSREKAFFVERNGVAFEDDYRATEKSS